MKKIILTVGICFVCLLGVTAQQTSENSDPTSFNQKVDKMVKTLTAACNLTPEQVTKIKPIVAETIKAHMANKQKYTTDPAKLKAANKATFTTENTKINAILNADQQSKLAAFEKQKQAAAQKRNAGGGEQE